MEDGSALLAGRLLVPPAQGWRGSFPGGKFELVFILYEIQDQNGNTGEERYMAEKRREVSARAGAIEAKES